MYQRAYRKLISRKNSCQETTDSDNSNQIGIYQIGATCKKRYLADVKQV